MILRSQGSSQELLHPHPPMYNILAWDVRSIANKPTLRRLKGLCKMYKISMLIIIEPKVTNHRIKHFQMQLGFSVAIAGCKDIWILHRHNAKVLTVSDN